MTDERDARAVWAAAERVVGGDHPSDRDPRSTLLALAERAPSLGDADRYGTGALAERLEARVAALLGKEAAVWMPSGTMAQQVALRIHAGRKRVSTVAFHPHCHLDVHEERGYEHLHGLRAKLLGERHRLIEPADVEAVHEPLAAVLLELPQRDLGGQLPAWDSLVTTCHEVRERHDAALHLDGARLWQCGPFYERGLDEIAALFDTVYVSFYKDLRAPAGCALAGPADVVDEARVWQVRHGGRLFSAYPFLLAAERGLDETLPRMPAYVEHARAVAAALGALDGVSVVPDPPHAAMLHLYVRGPLDRLKDAALDLAEETGVWLAAGFRATDDPGVQVTELSFGEASLAVPPDESSSLYARLLERAAADT